MIRLDVQTDTGWETLVLSEDVSFRIEFNSPLFEAEIIPGNLVYTFDIPVNEINSRIFKSPHILAKNGKIKIYDCSYFFANKLTFKGKLLITRTTSKIYSAQITVNNFAVDFKDISIKSITMDLLTLGADTDAIIATCKSYISQTYPSVKVNFPSIKNTIAYGAANEANPNFAGVYNYYNENTSEFYKNEIASMNDNKYSLAAQPYLAYVFYKIFEELNYRVTGDFLDDDIFNKLLIYSNYLLDNIVSDQYISIATGLSETGMITDFSTAVTYLLTYDTIVLDADNCISLANETYEIKTAGYHEINISFDAKIIKVDLDYLEMQIAYYIDDVYEDGYSDYIVTEEYLTFGDNFTYYAAAGDVGKKIKTQIILESPKKYGDRVSTFRIKNKMLQVTPVSVNKLNIYKQNFYIHDTLPDITTSVFLNALKDLFKIGIFFSFSTNVIEFALAQNIVSSNKYIEIDDFVTDDYEITINSEKGFIFNYTFENDEITSGFAYTLEGYNVIGSYDDIADAPDATKDGDLIYLRNLNKYYAYSAGIWLPSFSKLFDYEVSPPDTEFRPDVSLLTMDRVAPPAGIQYVPAVQQTATSEAFGLGTNEPGFKIMIWWGGEDYPYASCTNYNKAGTNLGNQSLVWDYPTYGIYDKYHKNWTEFILSTEEIRVIAKLPIDKYLELISLFEPNETKIRKIRFRGINYLPKQISALHRNNSNLIETEIIMIKKSL